jgi:hypothetical protein
MFGLLAIARTHARTRVVNGREGMRAVPARCTWRAVRSKGRADGWIGGAAPLLRESGNPPRTGVEAARAGQRMSGGGGGHMPEAAR